MVYVISKDGKSLMPTKRHGKVRRLLKQGLAKVVRTEPFTIQLLYDTTTYTQPVAVGVDIGSKIVGISATTETQELFSGEVELRQDIKKLLLERKEYRRHRRYCKRRYRKPRFLTNLIVLTVEEHKALHAGKIKIPRSKLEKVKILKDTSHVSTIGWHMVNELKGRYNVEITYGSITKARRVEMGLKKTHRNDSFVIAGGSKETKRATEWYFGKFFRRQNRSLNKANPIKGGKRPVNTVKQVDGFRRFDKVEYQGKTGIILGLRSSGYFAIGTLSGKKTCDSVKCSKLRLLEKAKTLMFERRVERILLHLGEDGVSCAQI